MTAPAGPAHREKPAPAGRDGAARAAGQAGGGSPVLMMLFLFTLLAPIKFYVGPLFLTPYRLFLLVTVIPAFVHWASGKGGRIYGLDFAMLGFSLWIAISLFAVHGIEKIELVAITVAETSGAYLIGRFLIRNREDYARFQKYVLVIMAVFLPAALLESTTGIRVFSRVADIFGETYAWVHDKPAYEKRFGMYRAQTVFEHPILFGVFASSLFGILYYSTRPKGGIYGFRRGWLAIAATFLSLSSGAYLSLMGQLGLAIWDKVMRSVRHHWKILILLGVSAFVVVDLLSNRTPFEVFISYASFNAQTGYWRILIFTYGIENVWANPVFGLGMNDWVRPSWMHTPSVDNFWLLMAMRHGIPGFLLIALAYLGTIIRLAGLKLDNDEIANMRTGLVVSLVGVMFALMTVHMWGSTSVFISFLLGAGVWMRDHAASEAAEADTRPATNPPRHKPGARRGAGRTRR